jgi:hypothetical protein
VALEVEKFLVVFSNHAVLASIETLAELGAPSEYRLGRLFWVGRDP